MHKLIYKKNKLHSIRHIQQKWPIKWQKRHPLILFRNNGTLQKLHMTNTPEIGKYGTHKKLPNLKNIIT